MAQSKGHWAVAGEGHRGHCPTRRPRQRGGRRLDPGREQGSVGSSTPPMGRRRHAAVASVPYKAPVTLQGQERKKQVGATHKWGSGNLGGLGARERQPGLGIREKSPPTSGPCSGAPGRPHPGFPGGPQKAGDKTENEASECTVF